MRWHDLLFLHWPVRPEVVRPLIPGALELDTFDGCVWIGVVPFHMSGVRPRCCPRGMAFPELNVRTYVKSRGRSGVWFFSLDATSRLAVRAARISYGLPYYDARITIERERESIHYHSTRLHKGAAPAELDASYKPIGPVYYAAPGTLDHWLTERYCLYASRRGRVVYGDIHHTPWPLQPAEVELRVNAMTEQIAIEVPKIQPLAHFARRQDVVAWKVATLDA
ncbi:MAG: YqjF family protein [Candidatus Binatia bacterium]